MLATSTSEERYTAKQTLCAEIWAHMRQYVEYFVFRDKFLSDIARISYPERAPRTLKWFESGSKCQIYSISGYLLIFVMGSATLKFPLWRAEPGKTGGKTNLAKLASFANNTICHWMSTKLWRLASSHATYWHDIAPLFVVNASNNKSLV